MGKNEEVKGEEILKRIYLKINNADGYSQEEKSEIVTNLRNLETSIKNEAAKISSESKHPTITKEDLIKAIQKFIPSWEPAFYYREIKPMINEGREYLIKTRRNRGWGTYSDWMQDANMKQWYNEPPIRIWDTATAVIALLKVDEFEDSKVIKDSIDWLKTQVRNDDGGYPVFPKEYWKYFPSHYIFRSNVYETSYATIALLEAGEEVDSPDIQKNRDFLLKAQHRIYKAWGSTPVGEMSVGATSSALMALIKTGIDPKEECIQSAVKWLKDNQQENGGWSDKWRGCPSIIQLTKTYDAICALLAAGLNKKEETIQRGVRYLLTIQDFLGDERGEWGLVWSQDLGSHDCNIENTSTAITALLKTGVNEDSLAIKSGIRYLMKTKNIERCWGKDTPRVIVCLKEYLDISRS